MIDVFEMENPDPIYKIAVTTWTNIEYPLLIRLSAKND